MDTPPRDWLRDLRRQRNLSQAQLAGRIGVQRLAVIRWEQGTRSPDPSYVLWELSQELGPEVVARFHLEWAARGRARSEARRTARAKAAQAAVDGLAEAG